MCQAKPSMPTKVGECISCSSQDLLTGLDSFGCVTEATCLTGSPSPNSVLDDIACISDDDCMTMPAHVATAANVCTDCTDSGMISSVGQNPVHQRDGLPEWKLWRK